MGCLLVFCFFWVIVGVVISEFVLVNNKFVIVSDNRDLESVCFIFILFVYLECNMVLYIGNFCWFIIYNLRFIFKFFCCVYCGLFKNVFWICFDNEYVFDGILFSYGEFNNNKIFDIML